VCRLLGDHPGGRRCDPLIEALERDFERLDMGARSAVGLDAALTRATKRGKAKRHPGCFLAAYLFFTI